jgi:hypothetical protein
MDQNQLNQIVQFLNLEKILIRQRVELYCFPKEQTEDFQKKLEMVKKELGNSVDLKIVNEGEIINDNIELPAESSTNGVN